MKEDFSPAAPTTAPNTSLGIKAGPVPVGKKNKDKNGKTGQGSQAPPVGNQIIMAQKEHDKPVVEKITKQMSAGDVIHDIVHSKNAMFDGDSKKQRIKRALAAYYRKQNESVSEAQEHADDIKPGDFIHSGFGTKGGAGTHGHVDKVVGNMVHFTGSETRVGIDGKPYKPTYKAPIHHVTVLHREDYIVDMDDLAPILEARVKKPHYSEFKAGETVRFRGKSVHGDYEGESDVHVIDPHSNAHEVGYVQHGREYNKQGYSHIRQAVVERPERKTLSGEVRPAKRFTAQHHHLSHLVKELKEDVIFEAGQASKNKMKRKYLGKTRGTTATGKKAHEIVIDPIIKTDDTAANRKQAMPAPDRGL